MVVSSRNLFENSQKVIQSSVMEQATLISIGHRFEPVIQCMNPVWILHNSPTKWCVIILRYQVSRFPCLEPWSNRSQKISGALVHSKATVAWNSCYCMTLSFAVNSCVYPQTHCIANSHACSPPCWTDWPFDLFEKALYTREVVQ